MMTVPSGTAVTMRLVVSEADRAAFDDEVVHDVYGTAAVVRHAEQVSRWLFRRCLADGEEGAGKEISVVHHHPVRVGTPVELTATVVDSDERRMVTEVAVRREGTADPAASVQFTQVLIDPATFGVS
jgi:predicted thioesterase